MFGDETPHQFEDYPNIMSDPDYAIIVTEQIDWRDEADELKKMVRTSAGWIPVRNLRIIGLRLDEVFLLEPLQAITGARRYDSASEQLATLHWLPVKQRCRYKALLSATA